MDELRNVKRRATVRPEEWDNPKKGDRGGISSGIAVGTHRPNMRALVNEMRSPASSEGQWVGPARSSRVLVVPWSFVDHLGLSELVLL